MKKYLILIAGSPATGKTYLVNKIKKILPDLFVITPDESKEMLADTIGFNNAEEKSQLEIKVWKFYYDVLELYMEAGKQFILSEYPFSDKQLEKLQSLTDSYNYEVITIRLIADFDVLWERRKARDREINRHLCHVVTSYHHGDQLSDRSLADDLITEEDFKKIIEERGYNNFQLGKLIEFDVSDFSKVDYEPLLEQLRGLQV